MQIGAQQVHNPMHPAFAAGALATPANPHPVASEGESLPDARELPKAQHRSLPRELLSLSPRESGVEGGERGTVAGARGVAVYPGVKTGRGQRLGNDAASAKEVAQVSVFICVHA